LFAPFVTVIAAMGGNIGIQSCTTMVRGIAVGEIDENPGRAIMREIRISVIVGLACAVIAALFSYATGTGDVWYVGTVMAVSLFMAILGASTVGAMAPALCNRAGIDPTAASGPIVTVTLDILGIAIYFTIALSALYLLH
jgi:magnesium transporter